MNKSPPPAVHACLGALGAIAGALGLGTPASASPQGPIKLVASDGFQEDYFGVSVGISGDTAAVGARLDDDNGSQSGSLYVFDVATGSELRKLRATDGAAYDRLGSALAMDGNRTLVAAAGDDDNGLDSGSAYLFDVVTGQELLKLTPADGAAGDIFGISVAMDGDLAIIGAFGDDDNGDNAGSAYVFNLATGQQLHKLLAADGQASDFFGGSVGISEGVAIVGAYGDDDNGTLSGSAYLFDVTTGQQLSKLTPDLSAPLDAFGAVVAIDGPRAVITSTRPNGFSPADSAVYLFDVTTGQQLAQLTTAEGTFGTGFGASLALGEGRILVGAFGAEAGGIASGSAWEFDLATGIELQKLVPIDPEFGDLFGSAVAFDGDVALVGAYLEDELGDQAGAAYLLPLSERFGEPDPSCVAVPNSTGVPGGLTGSGQLDVAQNDCTLTASGLPVGQATVLLASKTSLFTPLPAGNSNGNACLGGAIGRFLQQVTVSSPAGRATFAVDLTAIPQGTGPVTALPGDTWYFQAWHRDTAGPKGNNFTRSLAVTFQ